MLYKYFTDALNKASLACFPIYSELDNRLRLLGTGFFIKGDGTFLTCAHVIDLKKENEKIKLYFDNIEFEFTTLLNLSEKDIYVGKISHDKPTSFLKLCTKTFEFLNKPSCSIGFPGYGESSIPLALEDLRTISLFSQIGNVNNTYDELLEGKMGKKIIVTFLELNVYLNPGLSGGPTFNSDGIVCGMNFMSSILQPPHNGIAFARVISAKLISEFLSANDIIKK